MRTGLVSMALSLALAPLALPAAAADNGAVVGTWSSTLEIQGRSIDVTLEFSEIDGKLTGSFTGPRQTSELSDVAFDGETLTFSRVAERQGTSLSLDYEAKVSGETMEGTVKTPRGELPFTATRTSS